MAWCTHNPSQVAKHQGWIHSALIFSRCFFFPSREEYRAVHASRVQHMFGIRGLRKPETKNITCGRRVGGYTFGDVVIRIKAHGITTLPIDFLRM